MRLRLQDRIVIFFVVLLAAVQIAAFYFIRQAAEQTARASLREDLLVADRVFNRLLAQNSERLVEATRVLSSDYGFRQAIATRESETVLEVLRNHAGRVRGSGMALIGLDGVVVGDTLDTRATNQPYAHPDLIAQAGLAGYAAGIRLRGGQAYQGVVVPVLAPLPVAWVAMSFVIDDATARDLRRLSTSDVSFVAVEGGAPRLLATTLPALRAEALMERVGDIARRQREPTTLQLGGEEFEVLASTLYRSGGDGIHAVLQRSVAEGLAPSMALQALLLVVAIVSLAVTLIGGIRIARRITQPLSQLAGAAREVAQGRRATTRSASRPRAATRWASSPPRSTAWRRGSPNATPCATCWARSRPPRSSNGCSPGGSSWAARSSTPPSCSRTSATTRRCARSSPRSRACRC
jgi:hypothetical protein